MPVDASASEDVCHVRGTLTTCSVISRLCLCCCAVVCCNYGCRARCMSLLLVMHACMHPVVKCDKCTAVAHRRVQQASAPVWVDREKLGA
eukprot:710873-Pelagomonas_calceolata.AAC.1